MKERYSDADDANSLYVPEDGNKEYELTDTRKPLFTLKHLNKLRRMRDIKRKNYYKDMEVIQAVYGKEDDEEAL
jgi:hypothetical protein